jgi:LysR family transcriptional regulator, nitrogen assimilation regulatory protein
MNLKQLIYLKKAIELGNISRAAQDLNVAQTALGIQIRNLEEELGVILLERHSRGVAASTAGLEFLGYADRVLHALLQAKHAMRRHAENKVVDLNMGIPPSIMRLVGDHILTDFSKALTGVNLRLVEDFSFVLMELMQRAELSCTLTFAPEIEVKYKYIALLEEDLFYLTAPTDQLLPETITFREVLTHDLAMTGRKDVVTKLVQGIAQRLNMRFHVAYEVQSIRAIKNLVAKGIASTIMPYGAAEGELRSGVLRGQRIVAPSVVRTLMFAYPKDQEYQIDSPSMRQFISDITDKICATKGPVTRKL